MLVNLSGCAADSAKNINDAEITNINSRAATAVSSWLLFNRTAIPSLRPPGKYLASLADRVIRRTASRKDRLGPSPDTNRAMDAAMDGYRAAASMSAAGEITYFQRCRQSLPSGFASGAAQNLNAYPERNTATVQYSTTWNHRE